MTCPKFVDHLVFRVAELDRTERFYTAVLGHGPHQSAESQMYLVGDTCLFFTLSDRTRQAPCDKEKIGLNHLAFGVRTLEELKAIAASLDNAGIWHSGVRVDRWRKEIHLAR